MNLWTHFKEIKKTREKTLNYESFNAFQRKIWKNRENTSNWEPFNTFQRQKIENWKTRERKKKLLLNYESLYRLLKKATVIWIFQTLYKNLQLIKWKRFTYKTKTYLGFRHAWNIPKNINFCILIRVILPRPLIIIFMAHEKACGYHNLSK